MDNHEELGQHIDVKNFDIEKNQQKKNKEHNEEKSKKIPELAAPPIGVIIRGRR